MEVGFGHLLRQRFVVVLTYAMARTTQKNLHCIYTDAKCKTSSNEAEVGWRWVRVPGVGGRVSGMAATINVTICDLCWMLL